MRSGRFRRALRLLVLFVAVGAGLAPGWARRGQGEGRGEEWAGGGCAGGSAALLVRIPTRAPRDTERLSLDLPGPVLVEPTPCAPGRP